MHYVKPFSGCGPEPNTQSSVPLEHPSLSHSVMACLPVAVLGRGQPLRTAKWNQLLFFHSVSDKSALLGPLLRFPNQPHTAWTVHSINTPIYTICIWHCCTLTHSRCSNLTWSVTKDRNSVIYLPHSHTGHFSICVSFVVFVCLLYVTFLCPRQVCYKKQYRLGIMLQINNTVFKVYYWALTITADHFSKVGS